MYYLCNVPMELAQIARLQRTIEKQVNFKLNILNFKENENRSRSKTSK